MQQAGAPSLTSTPLSRAGPLSSRTCKPLPTTMATKVSALLQPTPQPSPARRSGCRRHGGDGRGGTGLRGRAPVAGRRPPLTVAGSVARRSAAVHGAACISPRHRCLHPACLHACALMPGWLALSCRPAERVPAGAAVPGAAVRRRPRGGRRSGPLRQEHPERVHPLRLHRGDQDHPLGQGLQVGSGGCCTCMRGACMAAARRRRHREQASTPSPAHLPPLQPQARRVLQAVQEKLPLQGAWAAGRLGALQHCGAGSPVQTALSLTSSPQNTFRSGGCFMPTSSATRVRHLAACCTWACPAGLAACRTRARACGFGAACRRGERATAVDGPALRLSSPHAPQAALSTLQRPRRSARATPPPLARSEGAPAEGAPPLQPHSSRLHTPALLTALRCIPSPPRDPPCRRDTAAGTSPRHC